MLEEGQRVEAGQIIALLDDSNWRAALAQSKAQLQQAEANVASAQTAFDDAKPIFERAEKQKAAAVISAQSFDESHAQYDVAHNNLLIAQSGLDAARAGVEVAQRNLEDTVIRAPFAGIVTEKAAQPGEMVSPISAGGGFTRTGIGTIVDMESLEVEVDVSENFINRVRPQQPVTIKLNAYPDWDIPGSVIAMIPTADRAKATVKVRIAIGQKDPRIIPEMGARVAFLSENEPAARGRREEPGTGRGHPRRGRHHQRRRQHRLRRAWIDGGTARGPSRRQNQLPARSSAPDSSRKQRGARRLEQTERWRARPHRKTVRSNDEHPGLTQNVVKRYQRGKQSVEVLHGVNLSIEQGEFLALMGPSGSGKTTLLNLIAGLDQPTEGEVTVAGERIDRLSGGKLAKWRARHIGFVFQFYNLLPVLDARRAMSRCRCC